MTEKEDKSALVLQATAGDRAALQQLLVQYTPNLSRHIAAKLPASVSRVVDVEDILQETFTDAFRQIDRLRQRTEPSFYSWLKAIAEHRTQDTLKALGRVKRGGGFVQIRHLPGDQSRSMLDLVELLSAGSNTPSRSAARHEAVAAIQQAIDRLPHANRQAVQMHLLQGVSLHDTAAALNRSPGAVKGLIDRAKKKMRAALGRLSTYE